MPLVVGQMLQNRYRIEALLGQGGFGAVYRAVDLNINFRVAIKENLDASPEAQRQFAREAALMVRLRHPSLPRVTDTFFVPGWGSYLVMDLIEGQTLQDMLDHSGAIDEARAVAWLSQVLDALAYLHTQTPPIIHRDLKPANIIVTPEGRATLVDFGIAKVYDPNLLTTTGARAVTPGYSPWEQYKMTGTDTRSDVYAAGATLYALLTGQVPPESIDLMGGVAQLTRPRTLNPRISPQVEAAIQRAMTTQPTGRFADAGQFKTALSAPIVMPLPITPTARAAPPAGAAYQQAAPAFNSNAYSSTARTAGVIWREAAPLPLVGSVVVGALWALFSLWSVTGILGHAIYIFAGWRYASIARKTSQTFSRGQIFWNGVDSWNGLRSCIQPDQHIYNADRS